MKRFIGVGIFIGCILFTSWYLFIRDSEPKVIQPIPLTVFEDALKNYDNVERIIDVSKLVVVVGTRTAEVTLSGGQGSFRLSDATVTVKKIRVLGLTRLDGIIHAFVHYIVTPVPIDPKKTSREVLHYVGLFKIDPAGAVHTSSARIGDRIAISNLKAPMYATSTYQISISYFERAPGAPATATPTIAKEIQPTVRLNILGQ